MLMSKYDSKNENARPRMTKVLRDNSTEKYVVIGSNELGVQYRLADLSLFGCITSELNYTEKGFAENYSSF